MVGEVVAPRYHQASILGVEGLDPMGGEGACEVKHQTDQGKGDLYNPNECWRCGGMGHFARDCTQDANLTRAIGKLHHTLEAETPVVKSLLTEFFNKLMRVQRKHDIVQAKLKKKTTSKRRNSRGSRPELQGTPASWESWRDESPTKRREEDSAQKIGKVSESEGKGEAPTRDAPNNKERCSE